MFRSRVSDSQRMKRIARVGGRQQNSEAGAGWREGDGMPAGQIVNEQPRPRVLVTGFQEDIAQTVRGIAADVAPTVVIEF